MQIGVIGLGRMGGNISRRLMKAGHTCIVFDATAKLRETLAKEGALASGDGYPRLEIEVLRADETSEGIVAVNAPEGQLPKARASELGVVVRAFVTRRSGASAELDTGDLRQDVLAGAPLGDSVRETWQREDALRAAARRLGGRAVMKVLGHPVVTSPVD